MNKEEFIQMNEGGVGEWWYDARRVMLERELSSVKSEKEIIILDLASACGGNLKVCSKYGKVIGLDIAWLSMEYCKKNQFTTLVQADAEILPFAKESIDVVVAMDIFEHLINDSSSMREIQRVLKRGTGKLIFNTPAFMALFSNHDRAFHHFRRYQVDELREKLKIVDLEVGFITYWSFFIFPMVFIVRKIGDLFHKKKNLPQSNFNLRVPNFIDSILRLFNKVELLLIKRNIFIPFGVSIFGIASKTD